MIRVALACSAVLASCAGPQHVACEAEWRQAQAAYLARVAEDCGPGEWGVCESDAARDLMQAAEAAKDCQP